MVLKLFTRSVCELNHKQHVHLLNVKPKPQFT